MEDNNLDFNIGHSIPPQYSRSKKIVSFFWDMFKVTFISLAIILPVRYFLIQPFYVKGASMEPNFYDREYLIIDEITYRFTEPERGDIVVFKYPKNPKQYFIKRVIGLPGEWIRIENNNVYVSVDGSEFKLLQEGYLEEGTETTLPLRGYGDIILKEDEYFLLGDNRDRSLDSRVFGAVKRRYIIGRTWLRGWPFNRLTIFNVPEYNF